MATVDAGRAAAQEAFTRSVHWLSDWKEPAWRASVGRGLLYVLVALLPLHAGLVAMGVPSVWKEVVIVATLAIALTLPARASVGRFDYLFLVYFGLVIASAAIHSITNLADLAPYFVYVPLGFVLPRLLVNSRHVAFMLWALAGSLLLNAGWMIGVRLDLIGAPDLLAVVGPNWKTSGSLTGGALATGALYGVSAGVAWIAGAVARPRARIWLLALVLTAIGGLTGSRAALVLSGLGALLAIARTVAHMRARPLVRALLASVLICIPLAAVVSIPLFIRANDSVRASRWNATIHLALENPLLGAGPGSTGQARAIRELGLDPAGPLPDNVVGTRVNESSVLKVAAEIGLPGLVAFTVWVASILVRAGTLRPDILRGTNYEFLGPATVVLTLVDGLTSSNMESFIGASLFWLGIGFCRTRLDGVERNGKGPHAN